jgi:tRNA-uridine 2-sulfurtransferase
MPIFRAKDTNKDQTYFLWQIRREQLDHILFPVGDFETKAEVREFAESQGLITSSKPDSQGLCFVGQTSLREMLLQTLGAKIGQIVTIMTVDELIKIGLNPSKTKTLDKKIVGISDQKQTFILGQHDGAFLFTIGQRQNLGLSNGPWFVSAIDVKTNIVTVCHQNLAEEMDCSEIQVKDCNWHLDLTSEDSNWLKDNVLNCECQVRYRSKAVNCQVIFQFSDGKMDFDSAKVIFETPVRAIAVGQSAVFYSPKSQLLGGGFIDKVI